MSRAANPPEPLPIDQPITPPEFWPLDPNCCFLNHGSFGACPRAILERQRELHAEMEAQPVEFFVRQLEPRLDAVRAVLGTFVGADPDNLVLISNATSGMNAVLRSLNWKLGDEIIVTNQEYNACRNIIDFVAEHSNARVIEVAIPFPLAPDQGPEAIVERLEQAMTDATRLLVIDHISSQTGLVMPVTSIIEAARARGIDTLIDGAHVPGMIDLDLRALSPTYYVANCHKWINCPKSAGFLYCQPERQSRIRPTAISHGANTRRTDRSRFQIEFAWTGTWDPTAMLCIPDAINLFADMVQGGWPAIRRRNRALALAGRQGLCESMGIAKPCSDSMVGALASVPIPDSAQPPSDSPLYGDPQQTLLLERHRVEVPIIPWPRHPKRLIRISAQLYNSLPQYQALAKALEPV